MFEQYKIGVRISLTDSASGAVGMLTRNLMLSEAAAAKLQSRMALIKGFFAGGTFLVGAGAAIGAPLLYAVDKAAELQKQLIAVQIATRGTTADMTNMRMAIEKIASQTIFSNVDVSKMAKLIATGTGLGANQVSSLLPAYAKYADVQSLMKGTPYETSITDAIRAAHGAGHYDSESLTKYLDLLTKASLIIPGSVSEVVRGLSYFQNVSKNVLGMSDEDAVLGIAMANRLGFPGTRGGTNLGAALTRSMPGVFGSGLLKGKSMEALTDMGMVDAAGHAKVFTKGKFDLIKWMGLTSQFVDREFAQHPEAVARQNIMTDMQSAYGTIGSRLTSALGSDQSIKQFRELAAQFKEYGGFEAMQQKFADESVAQQYTNAKTNFVSAMTELGITLLPTATVALKKFNGYMAQVIDWMTKNPGKVGEYAMNLGKLAAALAGLGVVSIVTSGITALITAFGLLRAALVATTAATTAASRANAAGGALNAFGGLGVQQAEKVSKFAVALKSLAVLGTAYELTDAVANGVFGLDAKLGGLFSKSYDPNANTSKYSQRPIYDPAAKPSTVSTTVHTAVHLDGKKVAESVTKHQANAANAPQTGISNFDPTQSPWPAGGVSY